MSFWSSNQTADLSLFAENGKSAKRGRVLPLKRSWRADTVVTGLSRGPFPFALTNHTVSGDVESCPFTALIPKRPYSRKSVSIRDASTQLLVQRNNSMPYAVLVDFAPPGGALRLKGG